MKSLVQAVRKLSLQGAKGSFIQRISLSSTMGPGVRVDVTAQLT